MSSPSCVYNVDETGMPLDPKAPKVVAPVARYEESTLPIPWAKGSSNCCRLWQCRWTSVTSNNYF